MRDFMKTIYYDLQGLKKIILEGNKSPFFSAVPVFSISRDINMSLYEANKILREEGILNRDIDNINHIKKIRQKLKSNQGNYNRKLFNAILDKHVEEFGGDIDNIGFYVKDNVLLGSTLFPLFAHNETPLNSFNEQDHYKYNSIIGNTMEIILVVTKQPFELVSSALNLSNEKDFGSKDIWHKRFFKEDVTYNVFLTRLLLIQSELSTCIWLENILNYKSSSYSLEKYILLRLSSIKVFETLRNLMDMKEKEVLLTHWDPFKLNRLNNILKLYTEQHQREIKTLRDMLHYSSTVINFYDYITLKEKENGKSDYINNQLEILFNNYIVPIRNIISEAVNIGSYESMTDEEKIRRRWITISENK